MFFIKVAQFRDRFLPRNLVFSFLAVALLGATVSCSVGNNSTTDVASSHRVELEIKSRTDAFGGASFGSVGKYELIVAEARGWLNPNDKANKDIVDLGKAPLVDGWVQYKADVVILTPKNPATARRVMFYDVNNRGNKLAAGLYFNEGVGANLADATAAGNGFLMRQGYTVVWSGWMGSVPLSSNGLTVGTSFPVAKNADGSSITGMSREEFIFDNSTNPGIIPLSYPAASIEKSQATLRVKQYATPANDGFQTIPASSWQYLDASRVQVTRPGNFDAGAIYEFIYPAKDPIVMGIGFAATRDIVSFLRNDQKDSLGKDNPLSALRLAPCELTNCSKDKNIDVAIMEGISQSGRFVRDYLWQGFNTDINGRKVFDGMMPLIAGARRTWTNMRFSQPGRWSRQHEDHFQDGDQFPFTYATTTDPVSGKKDGLLSRCTVDNTCPKVFQIDGGGEFKQARASLVVSNGAGTSVALPDNVRAYHLVGTPHGYGGTAPGTRPANAKYPSASANPSSTTRALTVAMVDWLARSVEPPASQYPSLAKGFATSAAQSAVGFPNLTSIGVEYNEKFNFLYLTDYATVPPTVDIWKQYDVRMLTTDVDGNDLVGVRTPDVAVPLATMLSWNERIAGFAGPDITTSSSYLPFAATAAARAATGDPRLSLAERYVSKADYVAKVTAAANALKDARLMLSEDVTWWTEKAQAVTVLP